MKWNYSCFIPGLPSLVAIGIVVMYIYIYIILLVCHMISQNRMIKRVIRTYVGYPLRESHIPSKFGDQRHRCIGDIMILVCHMIPQDHLTKG